MNLAHGQRGTGDWRSSGLCRAPSLSSCSCRSLHCTQLRLPAPLSPRFIRYSPPELRWRTSPRCSVVGDHTHSFVPRDGRCSATGFLVEAVADAQKFSFKQRNPDKWTNVGLWKYARYPNYFGEILFWTGLTVAALPAIAASGAWYALLSPLTITGLLVRLSGIPHLQRRANELHGNNKDYQAYVARTNLLLPLPRWFS
jgi:hypothetical protein